MKVEQIYSEAAEQFRQGLNEWADEGRLPPERSAALVELVQRVWGHPAEGLAPERPMGAAPVGAELVQPTVRQGEKASQAPVSWRTRRWAVGAAAAAALLLLPLVWEPARAWATDTLPAIAAFLGLRAEGDPGWAWALEHEGFQEVLAQAENRGYTFRVHRVLADTTQTTIVYTIAGPNPAEPDFTAGETGGIWFNGTWGPTWYDSDGSVVDGVYVGYERIDPLPEESGTLRIDLRAIGDVRGRWLVEFPVTRQALTALSRTIPVGQPIGPAEVGLTLQEVVALPTRTEVRLGWSGLVLEPNTAPDPEAVEVRTQSGQVVPFQGSIWGRGQGDADGNMTMEYRFPFDPLPADTTAITVHLGSVKAATPGERLVLPLAQGATGGAAGLPEATVQSVGAGSATVAWAHDRQNPFPYEWWVVLDDRGEAHRADSSLADSANGALMVATVTWDDLPAGRTPVALEARTVWRLYEGDWQVEVPLD